MTLWLVGMMGSGKTTAGRLAASSLGVEFRDTDEEVVKRLGRSVVEIWEIGGEPAFREIESAVVEDLAGKPAIVATGGGVVLTAENRERMRSTGSVVWLTAPAETLAMRAVTGQDRPLLVGEGDAGSTMGRILEDRTALYESVADHIVDSGSLTVEEVASRIEALWPS